MDLICFLYFDLFYVVLLCCCGCLVVSCFMVWLGLSPLVCLLFEIRCVMFSSSSTPGVKLLVMKICARSWCQSFQSQTDGSSSQRQPPFLLPHCGVYLSIEVWHQDIQLLHHSYCSSS